MGKTEMVLLIVALVSLLVSWYVAISAVKTAKNYNKAKQPNRVEAKIALEYAKRAVLRSKYARGRAYVRDHFSCKQEKNDDNTAVSSESKKQNEC